MNRLSAAESLNSDLAIHLEFGLECLSCLSELKIDFTQSLHPFLLELENTSRILKRS